MNGFDLAVIAVIVLSALFAYFRGFVREALSIVAWINAGVIAAYAVPYVSPLAEKFLPPGFIAESVAAAVVFILALMVMHMIASALSRRIRGSAFSPLDRGLGLIFGVARGVIFVCLSYILLSWILPPGKERPAWFASARSAPYLEAGAGKMLNYLPLPHSGIRRATAAVPGDSPLSAAEREAESAINAFTRPSSQGSGSGNGNRNNPAPVYTPDEQRDLNRLIQQQNGH